MTAVLIELIEPEMAAIFRSKTGAERLRIASGMYASARRMLVSYLRSQHPAWDEQFLQEAVVGRLLNRTQ